MNLEPVLIAGAWRASAAAGTFQAENPAAKQPLPEIYPVSSWSDCEAALAAAAEAARILAELPAPQLADFLDDFAQRIEGAKESLVARAHLETALASAPRLADVELPRTVNQLRQSAAAAREGSWALPTLDTKANIRSCFVPLGPVCVFGPNNFPFAYGSVAGGDFAAAIAAGNPVLGKANSSHPGTTRIFAELAQQAVAASGLPAGTVQLIYRTSHADGERLVADERVGATGYTGSRRAGLALKAAADRAGKPIYLELSSINPVVILPGALRERSQQIAELFSTSCLAAAGQMCTNPGLVLLLASPETEIFISEVAARFVAAPVGTLLSKGVAQSLTDNLAALRAAGAQLVTGESQASGLGYCHPNTLLRISGEQFLRQSQAMQAEAFGNASLLLVARDLDELAAVIDRLEGNLTGSIFSDSKGQDDPAYERLAPRLRPRVGRFLNDKMPTGVAVSPAMNHGGPYPATGHPGFTAVGVPAALRRFAMLQCFDNVREPRLPPLLRDHNPNGVCWRLIDGRWTQADVGST